MRPRYAKSCLYGNNKSLINVKTKIFIDSRLKEVFLLGKLGSKHEQYFYENGVLTHIEVKQWSGAQQGAFYTTFITYVEGLATEIINRFNNGYIYKSAI